MDTGTASDCSKCLYLQVGIGTSEVEAIAMLVLHVAARM